MAFIDKNGVEKKTLIEYGLKSLASIRIQCYWFTFESMKQADVTSILIKMQQYHDQGVFKPREFIDFLRTRKIAFKMKWIPCDFMTFGENLTHFIFITKHNLTS